FAADISHSHNFSEGGRKNRGRDLAGIFLAVENPRIALGHFSRIDLNSYKQAMHQAARAHALHNFLAKVTALAEVHRVHLLRFLRKRCAGNIVAVASREMFDTYHAWRI